MDLGDLPYNQTILEAKSLGAMPRISHMVVLKENNDFSNKVIQLLKKADERVNG